MNIGEVNWRPDGYTRRYIEDHPGLRQPEKMSAYDLAVAVTYCMTSENPYSEELCRRAGMSAQYAGADTLELKTAVVRKAAGHFNMKLM